VSIVVSVSFVQEIPNVGLDLSLSFRDPALFAGSRIPEAGAFTFQPAGKARYRLRDFSPALHAKIIPAKISRNFGGELKAGSE
jgi:hypothetical protein